MKNESRSSYGVGYKIKRKGGVKKAIVLLSGGLDSAVVLYLAKSLGFNCLSLAFDYGQRHRRELGSAKALAREAGAQLQVVKIFLPWGGSSLLDERIKIIESVKVSKCQSVSRIPNTYVPARNIIFLSFALSYAEAAGAEAIFIGAHAQDYSGYPDCRPEFYRAFKKIVSTGTKSGVEKKRVEIKVPLINKTKAQIIRLGRKLGVPFGLTWSCYKGGESPCGECDSCYFRARGFKEVGLLDPVGGEV